MSLKDKLESLKRQEEERKQLEQDLPNKLAEWQDAIKQLYHSFRDSLKEYEAAGEIAFLEEPLALHEDLLGGYSVSLLRIKTPGSTIVLTPVGLFVIGAKGRVDMRVHGRGMRSDRYTLLRRLDSPPSEAEWIVSCPPAREARDKVIKLGPYKFMPLSKDTIETALENMLA